MDLAVIWSEMKDETSWVYNNGWDIDAPCLCQSTPGLMLPTVLTLTPRNIIGADSLDHEFRYEVRENTVFE